MTILRSYYLFQAAANCTFHQPIYYLYYERFAGLSLPVILWLMSYTTGLRAVLDVPFGALADRWSRRACLAASLACMAASAVLVLVWPSLPAAIVAETLVAAASALRSGADSAFVFDALATADRLDLYPRTESRGQAIAALASGATAVVGGFLGAVDLRLPFVATVVVASAGAAVTARPGERRPATRVRLRPHAAMGTAARVALRSPAVRWAIALATFAVVSSHVYFFLQQPYLEAIGAPVALFGVVFAATKLVTAPVAMTAHRIDATLGPRRATAVMALVPVLGLGAMSRIATPGGAALILSRGVLDGLWQPLTNVYMNRLADSEVRATMLSLQSLVARLTLSATIALLGAGVRGAGLWTTIAVAAAAIAITGGLLVRTAPRA